MATKNAKQGKKDSTTTADATSGGVSMSALASLLEAHKTDLVTEFKTSFSALEAKIDLVQATVSSHGQRITSLETNADSVEERLLSLEATCTELTASTEKLKAKAADLEARSRRNNIRIIGLPESIEGPRPTDFFSKLLVQLLGDEKLPTPPELDRAHRSLAPSSPRGPQEEIGAEISG